MQLVNTSGHYQFLHNTLSVGLVTFTVHDIGQDQEISSSKQLTYNDSESTANIQIVDKPVFIEKDQNGKECLVYNSFMMEVGKMYPITYEGEKWVLKRTEKDVEFMKFHPNKK